MSKKSIWKKIDDFLGMTIIPSTSTERILEFVDRLIAFRSWLPFGSQSRQHFICDLCRQLQSMCRNKMSLVEGTEALAKNYTSPLRRRYMERLSNALRRGMSFSDACRQSPHYFSETHCKILEAGQKADNLDGALGLIYSYTMNRWNLRRRIVDALIYPLMLIFFSSILYFFILVFIVPRFVEMYSSMGAQISGITLLVIQASYFVRYKLPWIILLLALAGVLCWVLWPSRGLRLLTYTILHRIPVLGAIIREHSLGRFCDALGILLKGGVPLPDAVEQATAVLPDAYFARKLLTNVESLKSGQSLANVLETAGLANSKYLWRIRLGQWGDKLPETIDEIAQYQVHRLEYHYRLLSILEPMMIMGVGVVQACIAAALYIPLFKVTQLILGSDGLI